jgi:hypothetical protein
MNLYEYCGANPYYFFDPSGRNCSCPGIFKWELDKIVYYKSKSACLDDYNNQLKKWEEDKSNIKEDNKCDYYQPKNQSYKFPCPSEWEDGPEVETIICKYTKTSGVWLYYTKFGPVTLTLTCYPVFPPASRAKKPKLDEKPIKTEEYSTKGYVSGPF